MSQTTADARPRLAGLLVLVCAAIALYATNLDDSFIGDDFDLIASFYEKPPSYFLKLFFSNESGDIWAKSGIDPAMGRGFLRPVKIWLLKADFELWGTHALGFHLTSTAFYAGNVVMVFLIIGLLLPGRPALQYFGAWIAAIHPVFAEVVPFITTREEVVATFFSLAAFHAFLRFRRQGRSPLPFLVFYALALFTKESAIAAIGLPVGYDLLHGKLRPRSRSELWGLVRLYLPFVLFLVIYFALRYLAFGNFKGGDIYPTGFLSLSAFLTFHKLFFLSLFHPTLFALGDVPGMPLIGVVILAAVLAFVILRASNLNRDRIRELIFFGPVWYLCSTAVLFGTYFAVRHHLIPIIGLVLFATLLLDCAISALPRHLRRAAPIAVALLLSALLIPPTIRTSLEYQHASEVVEALRADIEQGTRELPDGCNILLTGIPQWKASPYFFGWALQSALKRPFAKSDLANRCRVIEMRNRELTRDRTPLPERYDTVLRFDTQAWINPEMERRWQDRMVLEPPR